MSAKAFIVSPKVGTGTLAFTRAVTKSLCLAKRGNFLISLKSLSKLESFFVQNGFSEVISFPFTSKKEKESINIDNPLDSNRDNLRISLKDSLIESLLYNERRQKDSIKLFEISDIYKNNTEIKQQKKLGLITSGRLGNNYNDFSKKLDFEYLNELLNKDYTKHIFEIIEIPRSGLDTKRKDKIYYIEISLEDIPASFFQKLDTQEKAINFITYKPISEYPLSTRDFSFLIEDSKIVNKVLEMLEEISDEIIKDVFMFDFYKNEKTPRRIMAKEVILALSSTVEGDTTNYYIYKQISSYNVEITVLARGVSVGDELEYTDEVSLGRSIVKRIPFDGTI